MSQALLGTEAPLYTADDHSVCPTGALEAAAGPLAMAVRMGKAAGSEVFWREARLWIWVLAVRDGASRVPPTALVQAIGHGSVLYSTQVRGQAPTWADAH